MNKLVFGLCLFVGIAGLVGAAVHWRWIDLPSGWGLSQSTASQGPNSAPRTIAVEVATAKQGTATSDIGAIGSLQSDESVQLAPEVAGRISEIRFDEGQPVKGGAVLVRLDDTLAKAAEEEMKVRLELANSNYDRAKRMAGSGSGTGRDLDVALAEKNTAEALLNSQRAQLAKLDITAPFDGVVGLRRVSVGSYVAAGTTLVNIEKIDVIKVDFKIPEANLRRVRIGQSVEISVDAIADRTFTGKIYAIDPMLDVNGRAISIRAKLENADLALRPGLFARVVVKGLEERQIVSVPEAAIVARGQDRFIWTIVDGKAKETKVTLGARKAGMAELEGVAGGATVVTAGHSRLRNGAAVDIVENQTPQPAT